MPGIGIGIGIGVLCRKLVEILYTQYTWVDDIGDTMITSDSDTFVFYSEQE